MNYVGSSDFNNIATEGQYPDWFNNEVGSYTYHSLYFSYVATEGLYIYGGVDNVADKAPPGLPGLNSGTSLYSGVGRQLHAGVKYSF